MKPALWFLFCVAAGHAQIITTIAGTTWLPPVSGTSAINAPLGGPTGVAVDPSGNIYFTDALVNVVGKISPQGTLTVIGGNAKADFSGDGGPAINASLNVPHSVAVDSSGNIYIADTGNHRVREISAGIITTVAGTGAAGFSGDGGPAAGAQLSSPTAIALDAAGNLYIADLGNNRIRRISSGMITTVAGNGAYGYNADGISATSAKLANPEGIALDSAGNIYIADSGNNRIREVSNRIIQTVAGTGVAGSSGDDGPATEALLYGPNAVAVDAKGNLYISDIGNSVVREVSSGVITTVAGNGGGGPINDGAATAGAVDGVYGLTADSAGNLYIAQYSDGRIRKVSGGIITTVAGNGQGGYAGDGGPAINALLNNPARVAFDAAGALYVADLGNNRVRKISGGIITTVAGNGVAGYSGDNGLATEASLNGPWGITLDAAGNLYIADSLNQRIRKVSAGIITTVAGNGNAGFSGDGGPAANASLYAPLSAAVDASGTLYIADAGNSRVRKVSAGLISTLAGNGTTGFSGDNGPAAKASLNSPTDVAVDSAGNIYIADFGNNRIRKVSGGLIATVAGNGVSGFSGDGGAASLAEFDRPVGVAVDEAGNLYIADTDNQRIRRVTAGIVNTIVGDGDEAYYGDGGSPTAAALQFPKGLVFDAAGNLYIADTGANRIREVLSSGTITLTVNTSLLSFSGLPDGSGYPPQTISITSSIPGIAISATSSAPWLTVSPASGSTPAVLQVSVSSNGFGGALITISTPGVAGPPIQIPVIVIGSGGSPTPPPLALTASSLSFTAAQGSGPLTQPLQITGYGSFTLSSTVISGACSWLSLSEQYGASPGPFSLTVTADPSCLSAGSYIGAVTMTPSAMNPPTFPASRPITVPVTFSVSPPSGILLVSQNALTFKAVQQGGVPLPATFGILNTGQGPLSWVASANTLSGGDWLKITPSADTIQRPFQDVSTVSIIVNAAGLAVGRYYGSIQISSSGAVNSPQSLSVVLNVLPGGTNLPPEIYPNGLVFTGQAGATPGSQDFMVANASAAPVAYISGTIGPVTILPANATLTPSQPTTIHVYPDFGELSAGITRGTVTLQFSDGSPAQAINVLMSVAPAGAASSDARLASSLSPQVSACPNAKLNVVFRRPQPSLGFGGTVGQPVTLEAAVSDSCGNFVVPGAGPLPQVVAVFDNGDPQQLMAYIGSGVWQASWTPLHDVASATTTVSASMSGGAAGQATVVGSVAPQPPGAAPLITGAANAASYDTSFLAPGSLITIKGQSLAVQQLSASGPPFPTQFSGTQVFIGGRPLPLRFVSPTQINAQVPFEIPINVLQQLSVQQGPALSPPQVLSVPLQFSSAAAAPGIYTWDSTGTGAGVIVNGATYAPITATNPTNVGDVVTIYANGLGAVTPALATGTPAPVDGTLEKITNPVSMTMAGIDAPVCFAGLAPGYPDLYQVNVMVPPGSELAATDDVPVVITVAGQSSKTVTMRKPGGKGGSNGLQCSR